MAEAPVRSQQASEIHQNSDLCCNVALEHFHFHHSSALVWNMNGAAAAVGPFLQDLTLSGCTHPFLKQPLCLSRAFLTLIV